MFEFLLPLHSMMRWLVVLWLAFSVIYSRHGWRSGRPFERIDRAITNAAVILVYVQVLLGLCLYAISPIVQTFISTYPQSVHQRDVRFFGLEHIFMMLLAVAVITIGWKKAKRASRDQEKFKRLYRWFLAAWLLIFVSIPWQFSPFTSRPYWRWF